MIFRKLRIAWSVFWGLASILLIVLWVRSYYFYDTVIRTNHSVALTIVSNNGVLYLAGSDPSEGAYSSPPPHGTVTWHRYSLDPNDDMMPGFRWTWSPKYKSFQLPHWFAIIISAVVAGIAWMPWSNRFSLRTPLVATTLVAMVLGAVVWAVR
jgi:hypothetical protein